MKKLEGKELYCRLQEARNLRKALDASLQREANLKLRIIELEGIVAKQKLIIEAQAKQIEALTLRVEELTRMVFGKGKKKDPPDGDSFGHSGETKEKVKRPNASYSRSIPKDEDVTSESMCPISACPDCSCPLTQKRTHVSYTEDIIPVGAPLKTVHKETSESGYCPKCKARKASVELRGAKVKLGPNIQIMIVYFATVMRLSYEQVRAISRDVYGLELSDGEIRNILEIQSNKVLGEYKNIQERLAKQDCHYDETPYKTLKNARGNYAWIQTAVHGTDTLFVFGESRGKGVIKDLYGESKRVGITDDYPAYDNIFEDHELCWSHPLRKYRDLAKSSALAQKAKECALYTFKAFQSLYTDLRNGLWENYSERFDEIATENPDDPEKLKIYKATLRERKKFYFTFMRHPGLPMDNNQAERRLRHLVLKRKISFGFKTKAGADAMAKLFSVVLTNWWKDPRNFLKNYAAIVA